MDFFDKRILAELKGGDSRSFPSLLAKVGFSHNTLQYHLGNLVAKGLVVREKAVSDGFGRPKFTYHIASKASKQVAATLEDPTIELVSIPFRRLRHVCRFEKGGYCKETKRDCAPQICPQIKK